MFTVDKFPTFDFHFIITPALEGFCDRSNHTAHQNGFVDKSVEVEPGLKKPSLFFNLCWLCEYPNIGGPECLIKLHQNFIGIRYSYGSEKKPKLVVIIFNKCSESTLTIA